MANRITLPAPFDGGLTYGGIGIVPRRQQDPILSGIADAALRIGLPGVASGGAGALGTSYALGGGDPRFFGLAYAAQTMPLRLLRILLAQDGTAQQAASIEAALAFGAGKIRFLAVKDWRAGKGTTDDDMTAEIARVFALYGAGETRAGIGETTAVGVGKTPGSVVTSSPIPAALPMLLHATDRLNDTGQVLFEAVGDVGVGVTAINDFDALTCRYRDAESSSQDGRHTTTNGVRKKTFRVFEQQNSEVKADAKTGQVDGWQVLSGPGIASVAWKGSTANPYGQPRNGAWLAYGLRKVANRRDFADWRHNAAFPKVVIEQLQRDLIKLAVDNPLMLLGAGPDKGDLLPHQFAQMIVDAAADNLEKHSGDNVWMVGEGKAYPLNVSDISGLSDVLKMERIEEIQALNMLPALVGITDGGTQAYAEVQWLAQTQSMHLMSAYASAGPVQVGNYHLRLLGEDMIVKAEFDDLPPIDPQKAAIAQQVIVGIQEHLAAIGVNSAEDFALRVSGGGAANMPALLSYLAAVLAAGTQLPQMPPAA